MHGVMIKFLLNEPASDQGIIEKELIESFPRSAVTVENAWEEIRQKRREIIRHVEDAGGAFHDASRLIRTVDEAEGRHGPKRRMSIVLDGCVTLTGEVATIGVLLYASIPIAHGDIQPLLRFLASRAVIKETIIF